MTYFPPSTQNGTIDPWPPTIVNVNNSRYEYARRYGTLEDPPDLGSIATGKLAILGIATSPSFFKSIDILPSIASSVTEYISVHSEPSISIGSSSLTKTWHFRADSFASLNSSQYEFGHAFTKTGYSGNSYGFYYGNSVGVASTGSWGVFIDDEVSNYFDDLVLVGRTTPIKINNTVTPIVQIFNNNSKTGLYVEGNVYVGGSGDIGGNLNVGVNGDIGGNLDVGGNGVFDGTLDGDPTGRLLDRIELADARPKPFDMVHPSLGEGHRLRYACIEGPEVGVYFRGRLKDKKEIDLPWYWKDLIHVESISIQTQSIGSYQEIFVKNWDENKIYLESKNGEIINCFYHIYAERKDVNGLVVEYEGNTWNDYPDKTYNDPQFANKINTETI